MKKKEDKIGEILFQSVFNKICQYRKFLLAYSGGMDSTVLLDIIFNIKKKSLNLNSKLEFRAIHINHNLNKNSINWVKHCKKECKIRNLKIKILNLFVDKNKGNIESLSRKLRYQALSSELKKGEVLLTAHHKRDQTETFLLSLKRGSGLSGLSSMSSDSYFFGSRLIRPLLNCNYKYIKQYAKEYSLNWIEDESNKDCLFDRNFLRLNILPSIYKRWPYFEDSVFRSAKICAESELLLKKLLKNDLKNSIYKDGSLKISSIESMDDLKRFAIIRFWLNNFNIRMPTYKQLKNIWKEVAISRQDSVAQFQYGNVLIRRFKNRLFFLKNSPKINEIDKNKNWPIEEKKIKLPVNLGILIKNELNNSMEIKKNTKKNKNIKEKTILVRAPKKKEKISVRFGKFSGLVYLINRKYRKKLKQIWKEFEIPPWKRNKIPLLFYDEKLIAAIGVFITEDGNPAKKNKIWCINWKYKENSIYVKDKRQL